MLSLFRHPWFDAIRSLFGRGVYVQVAALCWRRTGNGGIEVLLQTTRRSGRWIIPRGWPMDGKSLAESAREEAWEEAGVMASGEPPVDAGSYHYQRKRGGEVRDVRVHVFAFEVVSLADVFPEAGERELRWVPPSEAAEMVREPELAELLRAFIPR